MNGSYSSEDGFETYEVDDCFKNGLNIYVITQDADSNSNLVWFDKYCESGCNYTFEKSYNYPPNLFEPIRGEYIGKKNDCGYTFTGNSI